MGSMTTRVVVLAQVAPWEAPHKNTCPNFKVWSEIADRDAPKRARLFICRLYLAAVEQVKLDASEIEPVPLYFGQAG